MKTIRNLIIILTGVLVIVAGSTTSWAVKPENPGKPVKKAVLDSTLCDALGGIWGPNSCTIAEKNTATVTSGFSIPAEVSLVVNGELYVGNFDVENPALDPQRIFEFSIDNAGTIAVHNTLVNLRTINNSGTITIDSTSIDVAASPLAGIVNAGAINNSGHIIVENSLYDDGYRYIPTIGINIVGTKLDTDETNTDFYFNAILTNEESGTIVIKNSNDSTGIYNLGSISNFGTITVNDLVCTDTSAPPVGINNLGLFINEISGMLDNDFGDIYLNTIGIRNTEGTMVNYGTAKNNGGIVTSGFIMLTYGTINNYGYLLHLGGELVNYGLVNNYGVIDATSGNNYPHNRGTCIDIAEGMGCN